MTNITIPSVTHPNSGLVQVGDIWYACYSKNGGRTRVSLNTSSIREARRLRDELYAGFITKGAEVARRGRPSRMKILKRKPYFVRGLGEFDTRKQAEEAINGHEPR